MKEDNKETVNETVHDYNTEYYLVNIFGAHAIFRDGISRFINLLLIICALILDGFVIAMCLVTIIFITDQRTIIVQNSNTIFLVFASIMIPLIKYNVRVPLKEVLKLLKKGFFIYEDEVNSEVYYNIKRRRVSQIRFICSIFTKLSVVGFLSNVFQQPLLYYFNVIKSTGDDSINHYLPLPIYMPFNTSSINGFAIASMTLNVWFILFYCMLLSFMILYYSLGFQLIAQIDILNYSIGTIEKRAVFKFKLKSNIENVDSYDIHELYNNFGFQRCHYLCLRENIMHHQAILK